MTQLELWLAASDLTARYGVDVGIYIVSRINNAIEFGGEAEAQWWISLMPKINRLIGIEAYILH